MKVLKIFGLLYLLAGVAIWVDVEQYKKRKNKELEQLGLPNRVKNEVYRIFTYPVQFIWAMIQGG